MAAQTRLGPTTRTSLARRAVQVPDGGSGGDAMLELVLLAFFATLLVLGLRQPFIWVLTYIYVDLVGPQKIGWAILPKVPFSLIAFAAAFGGWLLFDRKQGVRFSFRQFLLLLLLAYCALTLPMAAFPEEAALKWDWVWKSLVFAIFLPLALTSRLRIEAAALFITLSIGAIAIDGGMKTVFGGGGYAMLKFFVLDDSGIYEGSTISTAAIAIIPLVIWLARFGTIFPPERRVTLFAAALVFACLLIPVGTSTRTGMLCAVVLGVVMMRTVKYRFVFAAAAGLAMLAAIPFLPSSFTSRMETIGSYQGDESASTRLAVWKWTLDYVKEKPLGGGFDAYLGNSFTYNTRVETSEGNSTSISTQQVTDEGRAFHSAYFEMLGEQGWPGLVLWLTFHALGLLNMEKVRRRFRKSENAVEMRQGQLANALQQAHIVYMVGALFTGVAFQSFIYMIAALEIGLANIVRREGVARVARRPQLSAHAAGSLAEGEAA